MEIPAQRLGVVVRNAWREFSSDRIPEVAAGVTFYSLLALFPALGVLVSLYGFFAKVEDVRLQIVSLRGILPQGAVSVLGDQMTRLATMPQASLGLSFAASLMLSIWSSNAGVKALIFGLNVAYEKPERRGFIGLNILSLAFTLGLILFSLLTVSAVAAAPATLSRFGLEHLQGASLLRWPLLFAIVTAFICLFYRYAPCRQPAPWRLIIPGGLFAAITWMAMSAAYSVYVANFSHLDRTYGSLGAVVGFMTWIWLSVIVVLFGAELNSALEQRARAHINSGSSPPS